MKWVFIDMSFLAYRALHATGGLEFEDIPTGIIFGFFSQLRMICNDPLVQSNRVAIFCDSRTSFRADVYPEYKAKRREELTEKQKAERERIRTMRIQQNVLEREILPALGFPIYRQEGLESDDLIAHAAKEAMKEAAFGGPLPRAVMITSDGDLYQCINGAVHWYDSQRKKYFDLDSFKEKHGISPQQWGEVKTIGGCSSDNVAGVPGVGETTAIKYLLGNLPQHHKTYEAIRSKAGKKIRARNVELVQLPHYKTKRFLLQEPKYDPDAFFSMCEKYGLKTFLDERKSWMSFFGRKDFIPRKRGFGL